MGASFSERLNRAERAVANLRLDQRRCPTCKFSIPGMPTHLTLGDGGIYLMGRCCPDCLEEGGGLIAVDPETGAPESTHHKMVFLLDQVAGFEPWLEIYGHVRFGGAIDRFLGVYRAKVPGWTGELDLSTPRTAKQIKEAEAATRRFPFWGGQRLERYDGLVLQ